MTTIQAWQHIYSNVEKEQSPGGQGGFQTLFYTHAGLTESEVVEMEGRLLYFPAKTVSPVKRLFFQTSTGKSVVSQIVPITAPDQYGRGGRYLAHSLIFTSEAAEAFAGNPFRVFHHFSFITNVEESLAQGDFQSGNILPASLALPAAKNGNINAAQRWAVPELKKLTLLALRAKYQALARQAITIAGTPEQIEEILETAFLMTPQLLRQRCSFDTYFYRCNLVAAYFWAVGLPESSVSVKFAHINGRTRQIRGEFDTLPQTSFERWVLQLIETGDFVGIAQNREQVFAVAEWLDGREYDLLALDTALPEQVESLFKHSPTAVEELVLRRTREKFPPELAEQVAAYIYPQLSAEALYQHLRQGFQLSTLLNFLYSSYNVQQFKKPSSKELAALESLLQTYDHQLLRLFLALWNSSGKALPKQLAMADETAYRQFVTLVLQLGLLNPFHLPAPGKGELFLELYLERDRVDVPELVEALLDVGEGTCLTKLENHLSLLTQKELEKLYNLIAKQPDIPESFGAGVEQALAAFPPEPGIKDRLKSVWQRLLKR